MYLPKAGDGASVLTNVVRLELVHADEDADGREPESPVGDPAEHRELARVQVVGQDVVKALCERAATGSEESVTGSRRPGARLTLPVITGGVADHVRVGDDGGAEDSVEDGVGTRDGGRADEGDEGGTEQALKRPVVRSVSLVRSRERHRVVDGALDVWRHKAGGRVMESVSCRTAQCGRSAGRAQQTHRLYSSNMSQMKVVQAGW